MKKNEKNEEKEAGGLKKYLETGKLSGMEKEIRKGKELEQEESRVCG